MAFDGEEPSPGHLFVWRGTAGLHYTLPKPFNEIPGVQGVHRETALVCPYCCGTFHYDFSESPFTFMNVRGWERMPVDATRKCLNCGFIIHECATPDFETGFVNVVGSMSLIRELRVTDSRLTTDEVLLHLRRQYSDVHHLRPRDFEECVAAVYRNLGYSVRITQQTRDGGYDLVLLDDENGDQILVECKLISQQKKLSVREVRHLAGVQLIEQVDRGVLVFSTEPTRDAVRAARRLRAGEHGVSIELKPMSELLREMGALAANVPPLKISRLPNRVTMYQVDRGSLCEFCRVRAATMAYRVPSSALFSDPLVANLFPVALCDVCAHLARHSEAYFSAKLIMRRDVFEHPEVKKLLPSFIEGLRRSSKDTIAEIYFDFGPDGPGPDSLLYKVDYNRIFHALHLITLGIESALGITSRCDIAEAALFEIHEPVTEALGFQTSAPLDFRSSGELGSGTFAYQYAELGDSKTVFEFTFFETVRFLVTYGCTDRDFDWLRSRFFLASGSELFFAW